MHFFEKVKARYRVVSEETVNVFVYETLMDSRLFRKIVKHDHVPANLDQIFGYREVSLDTYEGDNYHTIIKDPTNTVQGRVYQIPESVLTRLDAWEDQYERRLFLLKSGIKAYVYILKVSAMKDYGQNTSYDASPDELKDAAGWQ